MARKDAGAAVTADDVAGLAGVSRWTVNRAFRSDASISEKSRSKVIEAANQLGYVPDLMAASLASDRSHLVSLMFDDFNNPYKLVLMERLTRVLRRNGWDTLLVNMLSDGDAPLALLNASQRRVDAAVLLGSKFDDQALTSALGGQRIRRLIVFARPSSDPEMISICCDDRAAMLEIAEHVISRGYQRPLFLAGPQTPTAHIPRKEAFLKRWKQAFGVTPETSSVPVYDPELAYRCVVELLSGRSLADLPDVLVCENDAIAIGASDAVRHGLGLRIPADVAITGFDDVPQAANPNYDLTTYRQPLTTMAEALVDVLKGQRSEENLMGFSGSAYLPRQRMKPGSGHLKGSYERKVGLNA